MLLRSTSSPLLNSWMPPSSGDCSHSDLYSLKPHHVIAASSPASTPSPKSNTSMISRAMSESDLSALAPLPKRRTQKPSLSFTATSSSSISIEEVDDEEGEEILSIKTLPSSSSSLRRLLSNSGLDTPFLETESNASATAVVDAEEAVGGGIAGGAGGNGKICGGGGTSNGADGARGNNAMDAHYLTMIEADPGNTLLLGNYAKFLKEVVGDVARAQEYCERAIVANPGDGEALALYAGLVWETSRDEERADSYYNRAVQAAPDNCYVLGSYACFLWDAEEDQVDEPEESNMTSPTSFLQGTTSMSSSITAAS